jgi:hypothetical protein
VNAIGAFQETIGKTHDIKGAVAKTRQSLEMEPTGCSGWFLCRN